MSRMCRGCRTVNPPRVRTCQACRKKLPKKREPGHMAALKQPYEVFVEANDGYDGCWICRELGIQMGGLLQRDHWHNGRNRGLPRGILCVFHNRKLGPAYTPELLQAALNYVRRYA